MQNTELTSLPNATFARRITAGVYDVFLLFAVGFFYTVILTIIANSMGIQPSGLSLQESGENMTLAASEEYQPVLQGVLYQLGLYICLAGFYLGFWRKRNATLGMQTWRLKIINLDGHKPSWRQLIIRVLTGTVSLLFFGIGFFFSIFDKQNRTLHDIASQTRIIVTPKFSTK